MFLNPGKDTCYKRAPNELNPIAAAVNINAITSLKPTSLPTTVALDLLIFDGLRDVTKFRKPITPLFFNGIWQIVDDPRYEIYLYRLEHRTVQIQYNLKIFNPL